jgi:hypothetical protein
MQFPGRGLRVALRGPAAVIAAVWMIPLLSTLQAAAQPTSDMSDLEYEKEADNPVTRLYSLPIRYTGGFGYGPYNATQSTVELNNAIIPVRLTGDWFLITRTQAPIESQPPKSLGAQWNLGLSNVQTTLFISPSRGDGFIWGVGPVVSFPTATNSAIGTNAWGLGPSLAIGWKDDGPWVVAVVTNNVSRVGHDSKTSTRTNKMLLNPILTYVWGDGWSVGSSPSLTANWDASSDKRWTVPVGAVVGKAFKIGQQAVSVKLGSYYNAIRPSGNGPLWTAQLTVTLQFPR